MNHIRQSSNSSAPAGSEDSFVLIPSLPDTIGIINPKNWKQLSAREVAIIQAAISQADKLRSAAWDPGAAYLSGVLNTLGKFHKPSSKK